jgi:minor histocompatibility antigen H13
MTQRLESQTRAPHYTTNENDDDTYGWQRTMADPISSSSEGSKPTTAATETTTNTRTNFVLVASYATIGILWAVSQVVLIPFYVHLIVLVTCILYAACHESIILLDKGAGDVATGEIGPDGQEIINNGPVDRETMKASDAYQFPLVGSASLFGLYLAFKFLGEAYVNLLIGVYFGLVGTFAIGMTMAPWLSKLAPLKILHDEIRWDSKITHTSAVLPKLIASPIDMNFTFSLMDLLALTASGGVCAAYFFLGKPWFLNNIIGICFCLQGIERFSLGTYKIGAILLVGLFFYDIFWVFGTDVMVTVAKKLDGPIKLLFPRSMAVSETTGYLKDLSLLGLGDIVIPGFFLSILLRFDAHRANVIHPHANFAKPYFHSALFAYVCGLATTLFVMVYFNAAQPALLYLVPACLGSSLLCAAVKGELKELFAYSEEEEEEEEEAAGEEVKSEAAVTDKKKD